MHSAVYDFIRQSIRSHRDLIRGPILELGSYNMNGGIRELFGAHDYIGIDVRGGPGVDLVGPAHLAPASGDGYGVVVSTEMLEHDPYWCESVGRMVRIVRPGGLILITAAAPGRAPHGLDFSPHYRNIAPDELSTALLGAAKASGRSIPRHEVRTAPGRPEDVQAWAIVEGPCITC